MTIFSTSDAGMSAAPQATLSYAAQFAQWCAERSGSAAFVDFGGEASALLAVATHRRYIGLVAAGAAGATKANGLLEFRQDRPPALAAQTLQQATLFATNSLDDPAFARAFARYTRDARFAVRVLPRGSQPSRSNVRHQLQLAGRAAGGLSLVDSPTMTIGGTHALPRPARSVSVLAVVTCYNDADIIEPLARHLAEEGLTAYFVDNWSTDGTYEKLCQLRDGANVPIEGIERFPAEGPSTSFEWKRILTRKSEIAAASHHDWIYSYDSDEFRSSPWPGISLQDAISRIDSLGYNALDHTVLDFRPVTDDFVAGKDPRPQFPYFEFGRRPGHFLQVRAWKRSAGYVDLARTGGHMALFADQRIYPLKFLIRHYSLRSAAQAKRKLIDDQLPRAEEERKKFGWHVHLVQQAKRLQTDGVLWSPSALRKFDEKEFYSRYAIERLSGIGIPRDQTTGPG